MVEDFHHLPEQIGNLPETNDAVWHQPSMPFNEFVLKVHSRCNLACDYCYIYEQADSSWNRQPLVMELSVFSEACERIVKHAEDFDLQSLGIILHGGEPLLVGHARMSDYLETIHASASRICSTKVGLQTNGVLLDERYLTMFSQAGVKVAVSIDGGRAAHDRHRRFRNGGGSYDRIRDNVSQLASREWRQVFAGVLCTIDLANDPIETYESLLELSPPAVDFLLPHGNWSSLPPGKSGSDDLAPYGNWLIRAFDRWYRSDRFETTIRLFSDIIQLVALGHATSEAVGLSPIRLTVIETDGTLELVDTLKSTFEGATRIGGLAVNQPGSLDAAMRVPGVRARQQGVDGLSATCRQCPIHKVCGGGNYVHRYREGFGFLNPSVYCADLKLLIDHISATVSAELSSVDLGRGGRPNGD